MASVTKKHIVTLPEVKDLLKKVDPEKTDQIQRWTFDYVEKFAKISGEKAKETREKLSMECGLTEEEAAEIVNIMPTSLEELRAFTFGWKKLILTDNLEKILGILKENS